MHISPGDGAPRCIAVRDTSRNQRATRASDEHRTCQNNRSGAHPRIPTRFQPTNPNGPACDYGLKAVRDNKRQWLGLAEDEYRKFVSAWKDQPPKSALWGVKIPGALAK